MTRLAHILFFGRDCNCPVPLHSPCSAGHLICQCERGEGKAVGSDRWFNCQLCLFHPCFDNPCAVLWLIRQCFPLFCYRCDRILWPDPLHSCVERQIGMLTDSIADFGARFQTATRSKRSGFFSGALIGAALGLVWVLRGHKLAAISTSAATQKVSFQIFLLTFAYSLGAALPLFVIAYGGQRALSIPSLAKYSERIRQFFGVLMILTALALAFNWDVAFQQSILDYIPKIQLESNARLNRELQKLRGLLLLIRKFRRMRQQGSFLSLLPPLL